MRTTDIQIAHEFVLNKLHELQHEAETGDAESAHSDADAALLTFLQELGYHDIVAAWKAITPKWYA